MAMKSRLGMLLVAGIVGLGAGLTSTPTISLAQDAGLAHPASAYYRGARAPRTVRGPQVRGFAQRRVGGYSYYREDVINTYGNQRSQFGGTNVFRDPLQDRQTSFGPFDNGFFFDSGIAPRGGYSPYSN